MRDFGSPGIERAVMDQDMIAQYCEFDNWTADLRTGIFSFSDEARGHHGLSADDNCGLLNLIRCYAPDDRHHILELFETASMVASSFCFSTTVTRSDGSQQPMMCVGESSNFADDGGGTMGGVFVFPRFQIPRPANSRRQ